MYTCVLGELAFGIARAGMTMDEFNQMLKRVWASLWVKQDGKYGSMTFIQYSIVTLNSFIE